MVIGVDALEDEARGPVPAFCREQTAQFEGGGKARIAAEDNVALAAIYYAVGGAPFRPDDEIVDAIAVDIACTAHRAAR